MPLHFLVCYKGYFTVHPSGVWGKGKAKEGVWRGWCSINVKTRVLLHSMDRAVRAQSLVWGIARWGGTAGLWGTESYSPWRLRSRYHSS